MEMFISASAISVQWHFNRPPFFKLHHFNKLRVTLFLSYLIKVITKLPNSEQSYKGKVKTHNYINRQNQSTTGKL